MHESVSNLINDAVRIILENTSSKDKIIKLDEKHNKKIHFIPKRYRIFGGMLQSMNIQFGNFIEQLMTLLIQNEDKYEIVAKYSGKKSNSFKLSESNDNKIDAYISKCQVGDSGYCEREFDNLLKSILRDKDGKLNDLRHDIDLLFRDKSSGIYYYVEIKYNDDHDTGKFVDINRKFIKTYAYLSRELVISDVNKLVPILLYFNNKKMKGNIYVPEGKYIKRGEAFFNEFLNIKYETVIDYMANLSESDTNIKMFNELYDKVVVD